MNKLVSVAISVFLLLGVVTVLHIDTVTADDETFTVWICTDTHVNNGAYDYEWEDALNDADTYNLDFDICLIPGDTVNSIGSGNEGGWPLEIQKWRDIIEASAYDYWDFYPITGNHEVQSVNKWNGDGGWDNWSNIIDPVNNTGRPYPVENVSNNNMSYTVTVGNVMFILFGPDYDADTSYSGSDDYANDYSGQYNWWLSLVENNTDKNVICLTHHALYGSGLSTNSWGPWMCGGSCDYTTWLSGHSGDHSIAAWIMGHQHYNGSATRRSQQWNIDHQRLSAIDKEHAGNERHSYFLTFTNGSTTVSVGDFCHDTNSWDASGNPGNFTYSLDYAFDLSGEEPVPDEVVSFQSINNQYNNTVLQEQCRWFNWTRDENTTKYSIRIANDSSFSDVFLQLDNITVSNGWCTNTFLNTSDSASPHTYNYWENSTQCFFYLPYRYNITYYGYHYYQVRAYTT